MLVRFRMDFTIDVASDSLPGFKDGLTLLDVIERLTESLDDQTIAIAPGARCNVTRAVPPRGRR